MIYGSNGRDETSQCMHVIRSCRMCQGPSRNQPLDETAPSRYLSPASIMYIETLKIWGDVGKTTPSQLSRNNVVRYPHELHGYLVSVTLKVAIKVAGPPPSNAGYRYRRRSIFAEEGRRGPIKHHLIFASLTHGLPLSFCSSGLIAPLLWMEAPRRHACIFGT